MSTRKTPRNANPALSKVVVPAERGVEAGIGGKGATGDQLAIGEILRPFTIATPAGNGDSDFRSGSSSKHSDVARDGGNLFASCGGLYIYDRREEPAMRVFRLQLVDSTTGSNS
jgi:hypothetical protein